MLETSTNHHCTRVCELIRLSELLWNHLGIQETHQQQISVPDNGEERIRRLVDSNEQQQEYESKRLLQAMDNYRSIVSYLKEEHAKEVQQLKDSHANEVAELKRQLAEQQEQHRQELGEQAARLRREHWDEVAEQAREISRLKLDLGGKQYAIDNFDAVVARLCGENLQLNTQNNDLRAENKNLRAREMKQGNEIARKDLEIRRMKNTIGEKEYMIFMYQKVVENGCNDYDVLVKEKRERKEEIEEKDRQVVEWTLEYAKTNWKLHEAEGEIEKKNEKIEKLETEREDVKTRYEMEIVEKEKEIGELKRRLIGDVKTPPSESESKGPGDGENQDREPVYIDIE